MKISSKPVHKCHKCGLNLGDRCGVYDCPHEMWHNHKTCPGYNNEQMLQNYAEEQKKHPADQKKDKRRETAKLEQTESHHQGTRR